MFKVPFSRAAAKSYGGLSCLENGTLNTRPPPHSSQILRFAQDDNVCFDCDYNVRSDQDANPIGTGKELVPRATLPLNRTQFPVAVVNLITFILQKDLAAGGPHVNRFVYRRAVDLDGHAFTGTDDVHSGPFS